MSGPQNGKHIIVLATTSAPPPFPAGANLIGVTPDYPVINAGQDHVWDVRRTEEGLYTLTLKHPGGPDLVSRSVENDIVVSPAPPPTVWRIEKTAEDSYTIALPTGIFPQRVWTSDSTLPEAPIKLGIMEFPRPGQLWKFIPILDD